MDTFRDLTSVIMEETIRKQASSGLKLSHLMLAFRRRCIEGLNESEKIARKPRVTSNKRILGTIDNFVARNIND